MLHIVNKSPLDRCSLDTCLATAQPGGALLLIEDGVYAATSGNAAAGKLTQAMGQMKVYALKADLEARGLTEEDMCVPVEVRSRAEIGKLMETQDIVLSF